LAGSLFSSVDSGPTYRRLLLFHIGQNERICGRYVMARATGDLLSYFDAMEAEGHARTSWNAQDPP
jgi:hypothetical protein